MKLHKRRRRRCPPGTFRTARGEDGRARKVQDGEAWRLKSLAPPWASSPKPGENLQESLLVPQPRTRKHPGCGSGFKPFLYFPQLCASLRSEISVVGRRRPHSHKHKSLYQHFSLFLFFPSPSSPISSLQCSHNSFRGYHSIKPGDSFTLVTKTTVFLPRPLGLAPLTKLVITLLGSTLLADPP